MGEDALIHADNAHDVTANTTFVSSNPAVPGTIEYRIKVIAEQLSAKCLVTPHIIPTMGLAAIEKQPDCVLCDIVIISKRRPIIVLTIVEDSYDVKQYSRRVVQAVSAKMRMHATGPVTVAGESICENNLTLDDVRDKLKLHKKTSSTTSGVNMWTSLMKACAHLRTARYKPDVVNNGVETSLKVLDTGPLSSPPTYTSQQRRYQDPDVFMNNNDFATFIRIMGSERTLFIETESREHRCDFGLEMACRLNQDGGTLFMGNPGIDIPPEVCKEVVREKPTYFNDKGLVLESKHVVVFVDRKEDLDKYKTILQSGGKLLVFLCENQ